MKIAGSPSPPSRVVLVGDFQAGANIHTAKARNTNRNSKWTGGRQRRGTQRRLGWSPA